MKKEIASTKAPGAIGPYSQAVAAGNLIFVSGQLPIDAATGEMPSDIKAQTRQSIHNIKHILAEAGATLDNVDMTTLFLADMEYFAQMNEVYA
ncbi:MAG: Rid family detoxifying hydrolase, partial [Muribaculaceae bacterium]|nr:Rid family detoxifying hydrolase [Muribaculaceae bacterium]